MKTTERVTCQACVGAFEGEGTTSPLGFRQHLCPHCGASFLYPLRPGHRAFLLLLALGALVLAVQAVAGGHWPLLSVAIAVAAGAVLARDLKLRDAVRLLELRARSLVAVGRGEPPRPESPSGAVAEASTPHERIKWCETCSEVLPWNSQFCLRCGQRQPEPRAT